MARGAGVGRYRTSSTHRVLLERQLDVVNAVTIGAGRGARNAVAVRAYRRS